MRISFTLCTFFIFLSFSLHAQEEDYQLGPDSQRHDGVPKGTVTMHTFKSELYNNYREYYIYEPAQYDSTKPAALMVFQDGHSYVNEEGDFRVLIVFDNLIQKEEIPVIIGLFINPGHITEEFPENRFRSSNRSEEYDEMSDRYVTFLIDEIIPEVAKSYNLTDDPDMRAICGLSSGGICSFTAAWQRPDYFHRVMSHFGSFTNIRGGNEYPSLIRRYSKKDIKIFLQDGSNDLNNMFGDWWLSNLQMESALKFKGYDYKFVKGTGGHNGKHAGSILPESLIWLWNDSQK